MAERGDDPSNADGGWSELHGRRILVVEDSVLVAAEISANLTQAGAVVVGPHLDVPGALDALEWHGAMIHGAILTPMAKDAPTDPVAERLLERGVRFVLVAGADWKGVLPPVFQAAPICRRPLMIDELFTHLRGVLKTD
ncbi:MAG: hypothetical protein ABW360_04165 [Phenylobacterium sp.]